MKRNNHPGKMIRILLLCLCAMLAAGCACAEDIEIVNLGGARNLNLHYGTTLADGRILLAGAANDPGKIECLPTLLCLNRDRTVSWEFTDEAFGSGEFTHASELSDGTIAAVYTRWGADNFACAQGIRFFTPDGKPTGKETVISETDSVPVDFAAKSRLLVAVFEDDDIAGWRMIDMDGNEIKGLDNSVDFNDGFNAIDDAKWKNTEIFEGISDHFVDYAVSGGKTTVCFEKSEKHDFRDIMDFMKGTTLTIIAADENGMNPAKTEMRITPENVEWMKQYLRENAGTKEMIPQFWTSKLIPMDDGLWLLANFSIYEEREDRRIWDRMSTGLIKIPEM